MKIDSIQLEGFKSIKKCDLKLNEINIMIGANGAGKSNFISLFKMVQSIFSGRLQHFVGKNGGPDSLLYFGRKTTEEIKAQFRFGNRGYDFTLVPTLDNKMMFEDESFCFYKDKDNLLRSSFSGIFETVSLTNDKSIIDELFKNTMKKWIVYHFHDTSETAKVKGYSKINDNIFLRTDGQNIAAFLYRLREKETWHYKRIVNTIKLVAPFFDDFVLRPNPLNEENIELEWREVNYDFPFKAMHLSDGTLRFICLATALLQPPNLQPDTIFIDEPELGLHPYAINLLASLIKGVVNYDKQIIVSTQSIDLLNEFIPEDIIVVDKKENSSIFKRLSSNKLKVWLEDEYSLGDLWNKNILGGRPL